MHVLLRWCLAVLLGAAFLPSGARDVQATDLQLVPFASDEGLSRLARAGAKAEFGPLVNQFEPQANAAFCGPTSAAIVLNTVRSGCAP
jgi:phytochelatin synthase